jgi:16S rRNA (guanine527-N7)-methyltransferase
MATDSSSAHLQSHIRGPDDFAAAFNVSRETIERLATYERLLRQWQKAVNLVAPSTLGDVWHRHFADSAQLLPFAPQARTWVDLGSGAGFPGLVIAILLADRGAVSPFPRPSQGEGTVRITLIESNARKCAFLREIVRATGIGTHVVVDILSTRIEIAATQASLRGPDVVSARALAPLGKLTDLAAPLFASSTVGLFLKGRDAAAELEAAKRAWKFKVELVRSRTARDGRIVVVRGLEPNDEGMKP